MINPVPHIRSLLENIRLLGPMMGYASALRYLVTTRGQPNALAQASFKGIPFIFRRRDISAVKEVLARGEYRFLESVIRKATKPVILDIGSHIGLFSIWALSVNSQAEIHSIEASPETFDILSENVRKAQGKGLSWQADHRAAWGSPGEISFMDSAESTMSHRVGAEGKTTIPTITIMDLLSKTGNRDHIDVLKIDIEGAEESFLCVPDASLGVFENMAIEIHPALCDADRVTNVLRQYFRIENIKQESPQAKPLLYCRKAA